MSSYLDSRGRLKVEVYLYEDHEEFSPERNLLIAVLKRGILDAMGFGTGIVKSSTPLLTRDARGWVFSRNKKPFSFIWICGELDLNPADVRRLVPDISYKKKRECDYNAIRSFADKLSAGNSPGVFG